MMTSTFPSSRPSHSFKTNGTTEVAAKKEALIKLESALKKRINEFKELCLKEGELTGHLPVDYPLQPREPIPQIRRRINHNNNNLGDTNSIAPRCPISSRKHKLDSLQPQIAYAVSSNLIPFPSRPTSTNSSSSSISTASSHTRSINPAFSTSNTNNSNINNGHPPLNPLAPSSSNQYSLNNGSCSDNKQSERSNIMHFQPYYEETKPFQMSDFYKYSAKHRQRNIEPPPVSFKTTRQLQDEVLRKNSLKFSSCDDQIQASVKMIEKSGQKLIKATAKAIAGNPGLAEKINNILPNNGERY